MIYPLHAIDSSFYVLSLNVFHYVFGIYPKLIDRTEDNPFKFL